MQIITNNVPRLLVDAYELTPKEREEFDYIKWDKIDEGSDSATFFRYKGQLYDLGEFMRTDVEGWQGQQTDTFFSATLVRFNDDDPDYVIVGRCYA